MSAVDQLLVLLLERNRRVADHLRIAGFTEDEVIEAWDKLGRQGSPNRRGWGRIG